MNSTKNVLIICSTVMFCVVVAAILGVVHYTTDSGTALNLAAVLVGLLGTTIAALATLIKIDTVKTNTESILNGGLEGMVNKAVGQALVDHANDTNPDVPPRYTPTGTG